MELIEVEGEGRKEALEWRRLIGSWASWFDDIHLGTLGCVARCGPYIDRYGRGFL